MSKSTIKQITPIGTMSNLVGMYAIIWNDEKYKNVLFILGKADDQYYIVQGISVMTGEPNVCRLVKIEDMAGWTFYPNRAIIDDCLRDFDRHGVNRFKLIIDR